jgi:hypothetical protein
VEWHYVHDLLRFSLASSVSIIKYKRNHFFISFLYSNIYSLFIKNFYQIKEKKLFLNFGPIIMVMILPQLVVIITIIKIMLLDPIIYLLQPILMFINAILILYLPGQLKNPLIIKYLLKVHHSTIVLLLQRVEVFLILKGILF